MWGFVRSHSSTCFASWVRSCLCWTPIFFDKQVSRVFFWCQNTLSWQADLNFMAFPVWMTCEMIPATRGVLESLCARCLMQQRVGMHPDVVSTERLGPLGFKILTKSQTENCCLCWCETKVSCLEKSDLKEDGTSKCFKCPNKIPARHDLGISQLVRFTRFFHSFIHPSMKE